MADQADQLDRARRLAAARKVEHGVQELVTALAFGPAGDAEPYTGPGGASLLRDVEALVVQRSADVPEAEIRLRAAGRLSRTVANTLSADVAGTLGAQTVPGWVLDAITARQADNRALIDALSGPPLTRGSQPWVPVPTPPLAGGPQTGGEKTELPSATISIAGASQMPALIGFAANVAEQVMRAAGDAILLLVAEAATVGLAQYLVDQLDAAAATVADVPAGLAAVEAAGFAPDLIVGSRSSIAGALPGATPAAYPGIVFGPTAGAIYVLARSGVWCQTDEPTEWLLAEPAIGGREVAAFVSAVFEAGVGAVAKVAAA